MGSTFYPQSQNEIQARLRSAFKDKETPSKDKMNNFSGQYKKHGERIEKLFDRGLPAKEIQKLDKEFKARMERAIKSEQRNLSFRNKSAAKKQKGTIPDTGSEFAKGGRVGLKKGTRDHGGTTLKLKKKKFGIFGDSKEDQKKYYNMTRASARDMNKTGQGDRFRKATKVDKETGQIKLAKRENKSNGGRTNYRGGGLATSGYGKVMKS